MYLFSKATGGFYHTAIHGNNTPGDVVEITAEQHQALIAGQQHSKRIIADANGQPALADPLALPLDELKAAKNAEINSARAAANAGTFAYGGKTFSCDSLSRSDIDGMNGYVALFGQLPPGFPGAWKAVDNTYIPIADVEDWKAFYEAMVTTGLAHFAHAQQLKEELAAAGTVKKVDAIVW